MSWCIDKDTSSAASMENNGMSKYALLKRFKDEQLLARKCSPFYAYFDKGYVPMTQEKYPNWSETKPTAIQSRMFSPNELS